MTWYGKRDEPEPSAAVLFNAAITVFVYNASGQMLAEYTSAAVEVGGGTNYVTEDGLGSVRLVTLGNGDVKSRHDYLPFGEEISVNRSASNGYVADTLRQKFTQKERDTESGLDYFLARYYSSAQGRFTSSDEFTGGPDDLFDFAEDASDNPTFYADLHEPQSLNKYQYAYNNPLRYVDPNGHGVRDWLKAAGNAAVQVAKDTVVGGAKGLYNAAVGVPNAINTVVDAGLSLTGTNFRFGQLPTAEGATPGERSAMLATDIVITVSAAKASAGSLARAEEVVTDVVKSIPRRVPHTNVVVRGGTKPMPPQGTTFSGATGRTVHEAASGVPHNQVRTTTAGAIRTAGGKVRSKPERAFPGGPINRRHVNIKEGPGSTTFSDPIKNPVPKEKRLQ